MNRDNKCKRCGDVLHLQYVGADGEELRICPKCGNVIFDQEIDALEVLKNIVRSQTDQASDYYYTEELKSVIDEKYHWLSYDERQILSRVLVADLLERAMFEVKSEAQEGGSNE